MDQPDDPKRWADLRAKVLALPAPLWMAEDPSDALIWRGDVLALLDEEVQP